MKLTVIENEANYELDIKNMDQAKRKCMTKEFARCLMICILIAVFSITAIKIVSVLGKEGLSKQFEIIPYILGTGILAYLFIDINSLISDYIYIRKTIYMGKYVDITLVNTGIDRLIISTEAKNHVIHKHLAYPDRIMMNGISETYFDLDLMAICSPFKKESVSGNDVRRS